MNMDDPRARDELIDGFVPETENVTRDGTGFDDYTDHALASKVDAIADLALTPDRRGIMREAAKRLRQGFTIDMKPRPERDVDGPAAEVVRDERVVTEADVGKTIYQDWRMSFDEASDSEGARTYSDGGTNEQSTEVREILSERELRQIDASFAWLFGFYRGAVGRDDNLPDVATIGADVIGKRLSRY